jgi:hypothetical protein
MSVLAARAIEILVLAARATEILVLAARATEILMLAARATEMSVLASRATEILMLAPGQLLVFYTLCMLSWGCRHIVHNITFSSDRELQNGVLRRSLQLAIDGNVLYASIER